MALRVSYRSIQAGANKHSHSNPTRGQASHHAPRKNGSDRSYSVMKDSHPFPVGMPSIPVLPGNADFHHFERNVRDSQTRRTTLTFADLRKLERDNNDSLKQLFKEVQKLNSNFEKLINILEKPEKKNSPPKLNILHRSVVGNSIPQLRARLSHGAHGLSRPHVRKHSLHLKLELSRNVATVSRSHLGRSLYRNFSSANRQYFLSIPLEQNKDNCLWLQKITNVEKTEEIFDWTIRYYLSRFNRQSVDSRKINWETLRKTIQPLSLPSFDSTDTYGLLLKMLNIIPKQLIKGRDLLEEYEPIDFLHNPTDCY